MKLLFITLLFPSIALAEVCDTLGIYAFHLKGCSYSELGVDTTIPLCEQEKWRHLAWLDDRCYHEIEHDPRCTAWACPAPYDRLMVEPISGRKKLFLGSRELVDWNYRAARATIGILQKKRGGKSPR